MKRMQQQRQELDRLKGSRPFGSRRPSLVSDHGMESEPARDPAHRHDDQVAFLRAELSRSMQREKSLILNIQDRDQKIESAERYLGNMESVVKKLSKYTEVAALSAHFRAAAATGVAGPPPRWPSTLGPRPAAAAGSPRIAGRSPLGTCWQREPFGAR